MNVPIVGIFAAGILVGIVLCVMVLVIWRTIRYLHSRSYRLLEGRSDADRPKGPGSA
jgi:hypothetical protein